MTTSKEERYKVFLVDNDKQTNILKLYKKFKKNCVNYLYSEYSFVIHDKANQSYFAVRDTIGFKPLYYTISNNRFYFASDIGDIFKISGIKKEFNFFTMQSIIFHSTISYSETMYKNIKRVPPGHYMYVSNNGKCKIERYWKPEEIKINYMITEKEAKEQLLTLLDKAIFDRIDDISTTGFELSGGLDSSSIVSWVKHQKPQETLTAFSMNFKSMENCDESEYINAMQEKYDINLQNLATDKMDYKHKYSLENNYKLNPHWPIFITYTMGFSVVGKAKELGIKTILTGQGGDNVLAGNLYVLHEYFKHIKWVQLYKELKALPHPKNMIKRYIILPALGEKNIRRLRAVVYKIKKNDNRPDIMFQEFSDFYTGNSYVFKFDLSQVLHSTLSVLMESGYYHVAEKHFGIEFKHPFFDRRLIEFMLTLPPKFKYSEGLSKRLLRIAMKGILPEKIRQRDDKAEFSEVLRQQIDTIDLDDLLDNSNLSALGLIDQKKLDKYKEHYLNGKMKNVVYFWQLINLEYWYRYNFLDDHNLEKR